MADPARARLLEELSAAHRPVLAGLAVTAVSGLLLLAADLETYLASPVYWVKMGLVVLLLANGALLARTERALAMPELDAGAAAASWRRLRRSAHASRLLWLLILFAGVALVNVA